MNRQISKMNPKMKQEDEFLMTLIFNNLSEEYDSVIETIQANKTYDDLSKVLRVLKIREDKKI